MVFLVILTLILAPSYILQFKLFGLSTNLLMVWVLIVWTVFLLKTSVQRKWGELGHFIQTANIKILIIISLFFLSGILSLFWKGITMGKLGQFVVLFLQPVSLFFITGFTIRENPSTTRSITNTCYVILAALGAFAAIQFFTLWGLNPSYWGNSTEPKRAISVFVHPNFFALFSAPLLAFLLPDLKLKVENVKSNWISIIAWLLGATGLFFSLSRAGWMGLAMATGIYMLVAGGKKIRFLALTAATIATLVIIAVPNFRYRLLMPFYGEKSAVSRLSLWQAGWEGVRESPLMGLGLTGFSHDWTRLNTDPHLDNHNFPHNIFLNVWVETGILGLGSFVGLIGYIIWRGVRPFVPLSGNNMPSSTIAIKVTEKPQHSETTVHNASSYRLATALFFITLLTQGLVDNPYFKNDLAVVFWIILSLAM